MHPSTFPFCFVYLYVPLSSLLILALFYFHLLFYYLGKSLLWHRLPTEEILGQSFKTCHGELNYWELINNFDLVSSHKLSKPCVFQILNDALSFLTFCEDSLLF